MCVAVTAGDYDRRLVLCRYVTRKSALNRSSTISQVLSVQISYGHGRER